MAKKQDAKMTEKNCINARQVQINARQDLIDVKMMEGVAIEMFVIDVVPTQNHKLHAMTLVVFGLTLEREKMHVAGKRQILEISRLISKKDNIHLENYLFYFKIYPFLKEG